MLFRLAICILGGNETKLLDPEASFSGKHEDPDDTAGRFRPKTGLTCILWRFALTRFNRLNLAHTRSTTL